MKTYTKVHTDKRIAEIHLGKIKKRGGIANTKAVEGGIQIEYYFPENAAKPPHKKPEAKVKPFDILSPDGISIRLGDQGPFTSFAEGWAYFDNWKKRFEQQGYYSSNYGRIRLEDLAEECQYIEIKE